MSEVIAERRKIWLAIVFVLMVALLLALRAPWTSSLWLDETLSAWTVNGTFSDAWNRSLAFQTQSPLFYLVLWSFIHYLGDGEIMLRSVSILSAVGSVVAVFSIAKKLSGNWEVPLLSCGFLLSCDVFQIGALTARPYALATLTALCSVACLIELLREWRARMALLFVSSVVLTVYTHYLFGIVVLAHGVVLMRHRQVLRRLWALLLGGAVACLPALGHLRALQERASGLAFTSVPNIRGLLVDSVPSALVVSAGVGILLALIWDARFRFSQRSRDALTFLTPYVLVGPLAFFIASTVSGAAVWLPRYWEWQVGPLSIVVAVVVTSLAGGQGARLAVWGSMLFVVGRLSLQTWRVEGWGAAAEAARQYSGRVILFTGLIESETRSGAEKQGFEEYVRAPLLVYGRRSDVDVVRLSGSEGELLEVFKTPALLVAARKAVGTNRSPERFLQLARKAGRVVVEDPQVERIVAVYRLQ